MFRGQARVAARKQWVRVTAAGLFVGGTIALASGGAAADACLIAPPFGQCPGTTPTSPTTTSTTTTAVPTPTTAAPRPAPTMTAEQAAARLLALVNGERTERGLPAVDARSDVGSIAMKWSAAMARRGELAHNDQYFSRDNRRKLDARALGENVARAADVESAHRALMASEHHRANLLDKRFTVAGFGAELASGSWWFTQNFVQPVVRAAAQTPSTSSPAEDGPRSSAPEVRRTAKRGVALAAASPAPTGPVTAEAPTRMLIERTDEGRRDLAGRSRPDRQQATAVALLGVIVVMTLALRQWAVRQVLRARRAHRPMAAPETNAGMTIDADTLECGRRHLAVISSWTRTLEDRWTTMPPNDKRVAMQAIERSAEEALADMALA